MIAVTVAVFRLGLMAATKASGATVSTSKPKQPGLPGIRNQHRYGTAIDRAAHRP